MRNILLLLGIVGLIAFQTEALESEENVSELTAADTDLTDLEVSQEINCSSMKTSWMMRITME